MTFKNMKVNIEVVRTSRSNMDSKKLGDLVKSELRGIGEVQLHSKLTEFSSVELTENILCIYICELETTDATQPIDPDVGVVKLSDVKKMLHIYRYFEGGSQTDTLEDLDADDPDSTSVGSAIYWSLPAREFHGYWDSLIFDADIKQRLLKYAWTMVQYSIAQVDSSVICCNRIVLLHGPPGTGKTTLCRAIAQKLSIRLSNSYDQTILVEINAHSLFSKYFSESGKQVSRMFIKLKEIVSNSKILVCILLDEVESLAHSRQAAASSAEPSDSVRVVNALLTHLDHLKQSPNVIVLSTSNISGVVDSAFLDRADISFYVPNPSPFAIYSIYYSCIKELIRVGMVEGSLHPKLKDQKTFDLVSTSGEDSVSLLKSLSLQSIGLSGRTLRKVPILAHSYYLSASDVNSVVVFIKAMQTIVNEIKTKNKNANSIMNGDI